MELIEHPLEAVAFRLYYSLPEASAATGAAAWTCLAAALAAAAAAGLWRLRSPAAVVTANPLELKPATPAAEGTRPPDLFSSPERPAAASTAAPSPKERYTAYFRDSECVGFCYDVGDEEEEEEADDEDGDGGAYYRRAPETTPGPLVWKKAVVRTLPLSPVAAADATWRHRRSPTAALGGCVVQLWDHQAAGVGGSLSPTTAASPRRRGRAAVGGTVAAAF